MAAADAVETAKASASPRNEEEMRQLRMPEVLGCAEAIGKKITHAGQ